MTQSFCTVSLNIFDCLFEKNALPVFDDILYLWSLNVLIVSRFGQRHLLNECQNMPETCNSKSSNPCCC